MICDKCTSAYILYIVLVYVSCCNGQVFRRLVFGATGIVSRQWNGFFTGVIGKSNWLSHRTVSTPVSGTVSTTTD